MIKSRMRSEDYPRSYFEDGDGSNYVAYGDDPGWVVTLLVMRGWIPPGSKVRELGCAKGYFVQHAWDAGYHALGIDISGYAISQAPEMVRGHVTEGNAVSLPWWDSTADVVCSWEFLEHVYEDELDAVMQEMLRVRKPDGELWHRIGTLDPVGGDPAYVQNDRTHRTEKSGDWWRAWFEDHNLTRLEDREEALNQAFVNRDWAGRFFVYG